MTHEELLMLEGERDYLGRVKPARVGKAMRRIVRLAKKQGIGDDVREHLWYAHRLLRVNGNSMAAYKHIARAVATRGRG